MTCGLRIKCTPSGQYAVKQCIVNGHEISFNPDDDRFYVTPVDKPAHTIATFKGNPKGWTNATYFTRRLSS